MQWPRDFAPERAKSAAIGAFRTPARHTTTGLRPLAISGTTVAFFPA
jgi:hypothetical protein